eukprot:scaffold96698_cov17-Prasinocladus_malaysianus.AAC.1
MKGREPRTYVYNLELCDTSCMSHVRLRQEHHACAAVRLSINALEVYALLSQTSIPQHATTRNSRQQ